MRYYGFLALASIALFLDLLLFGLGLAHPTLRLRFSGPTAALADSHSVAPQPILAPTARPRPATRILRPTRTPLPTGVPSPTPSPTPTVTPTPPPTATPTPPPQIVASGAAAFTQHNRAVRANIRLALSHYNGALTHVVIPPGGLFSFNAALGLDPERLPWKDVITEQPAAASIASAPDGSVPEAPAPISKRVRGGGLCDLASRYVMAARPLLPSRAFRFVNHVRSTGISLNGVPARDSVAIWAVGGRAGEQDLLITNVTGYWLEFVVEQSQEKITVRAHLWDDMPPSW
jgi:hypothetical protein